MVTRRRLGQHLLLDVLALQLMAQDAAFQAYDLASLMQVDGSPKTTSMRRVTRRRQIHILDGNAANDSASSLARACGEISDVVYRTISLIGPTLGITVSYLQPG